MNIVLLIFDLLVLPVTLIRLLFIYLFGSKYNIKSLKFLDVMMHADNKYFNQLESDKTVDTIKDDVRVVINECSKIDTTQNLENLTTFLFCGEVLTSMTAKRILNNFPNSKVLNTYGPTEATVATTLVDITPEIIAKYPKNLPVGYVKKNTTINLLDIDAENIGEMEIVGDNVSIGYFKNDVLNSQKFEAKYEKRSFRTGDYGYFEDDMLFFANRKDELIKLHGFRIELGEIDKEFTNCSDVSEAITIPLKRGTEVVKLITFIVVKSAVNIEDLKEEVSKVLPYYMIPSDVIILEKFPYNTNHKIDKNELINIYKAL